MESKHITVSNLTLDLWLDYVKPALGSDTAPAEIADEISHCMTAACFNTEYKGNNHDENVRREALQMLYQIAVSIKYREFKGEMLMLHNHMVQLLNA